MPRKKALVLLNISAGVGKAGTHTLEIIQTAAEHGYEPIVYPIIPKSGLVTENILPDHPDAELILCSGGDGTLNHVVQTVLDMGTKPRIGYIPTGSTNDFARSLGIPLRPNLALEAVFDGEPYAYDVGSLNGRYFNYVAAFGAFSAISYATDQQLKNVLGHAAYILNAIAELGENIRYNRRIRVETEDWIDEDDYVFGTVCGTSSIGGFPMFKNVDSRMDDGKMELMLVKTPKNTTDLQEIVNAILSGTMDHPCITLRQVSAVKLSCETAIPWTVDGEFGGEFKDAEIKVLPQAVTIMRNKR